MKKIIKWIKEYAIDIMATIFIIMCVAVLYKVFGTYDDNIGVIRNVRG